MSQSLADASSSLPPPLHPPSPLRSSVTFDMLPRGAQPSPMQQCWQVNAWGLLVVACLLPFLVLRSLQCAARRRRHRQQSPRTAGDQAGRAPSNGQSSRSAAGNERAEVDAGGEGSSQPQPAAGHFTPLLRPPGWWLLEPWLASALLWRAAGLAAALLAPAS